MNSQQQLPHQHQQQIPQVYAPYYEDEISLIDLWLVLVRRKKLIISVFLFFLLAALVVAFVKKEKFEFTSSFEIGRMMTSNGDTDSYTSIESAASVKAKLQNAYLPAAMFEYFKENEDQGAIKVEIDSPKDANMLVLKSKGREADLEIHKAIHQKAVQPLLNDLNRIIHAQRNKIETELALANLTLKEMSDPITLKLKKRQFEKKIEKEKDTQKRLNDDIFWAPKIKALESKIEQGKASLENLKHVATVLVDRKERLDELEKVLLRQLYDLDSYIAEAQEKRGKAIKGVNESSDAMTQLLIDSEVEGLVLRRSNLEERLYFDIRNQKDELENKVLENQNQQDIQAIKIAQANSDMAQMIADRKSQITLEQPNLETLETEYQQMLRDHEHSLIRQQDVIKNIEARLNSITESRVIVPFLQSLSPTGMNAKILFLLVLFLGAVFAIIAAFIAEFLDKARERMQEEGMV